MKVTEYVIPLGQDGRRNLALTFAEKDLKENWIMYREKFLKEVYEK